MVLATGGEIYFRIFDGPYLRSFVVARIKPLSWVKDEHWKLRSSVRASKPKLRCGPTISLLNGRRC